MRQLFAQMFGQGFQWKVLLLAALLVSPALAGAAQAPAVAPAEQDSNRATRMTGGGVDLSTYYDQIFQIKVVARNAGGKSSIGSGFQVSADGLVATNYHVVSGAVNAPDTHRIEYRDHTGATGELELLDFDVVHDLALLRHPQPRAGFFAVDSAAVRRGDLIYALGNPQDLGITLKFGAYNGMVEHSFDPQILFSGSLNPGMSGGPGLLADGRVIGVNVATAGSDLSFLVPAERLQALIDRQRTLTSDDFPQEIGRQVAAWQERRFADLLRRDWQLTDLGDFQALGEVRNDMQCWGRSNEDDEDVTVVTLAKGCNAANRIYLDRNFNTGQIHYSFAQKTSRGLNPLRFHHALKDSAGPDNRADKTQVTNFECASDFITLPPASESPGWSTKAHFCVRAYVDMPALFDVLWLAERSNASQAFSAHFTLAGVPEPEALAFTDKFLETLRWK